MWKMCKEYRTRDNEQFVMSTPSFYFLDAYSPLEQKIQYINMFLICFCASSCFHPLVVIHQIGPRFKYYHQTWCTICYCCRVFFFYFFQSRERIADEVKIVGAFQSFHCFPYCCCCSIIIFFPFWFLPSERMWKERKKREKKIEFPLGIHCNKGNSEKKYIHTQRLNGAPSRVQVIRHNVLEIDYCRETRAK